MSQSPVHSVFCCKDWERNPSLDSFYWVLCENKAMGDNIRKCKQFVTLVSLLLVLLVNHTLPKTRQWWDIAMTQRSDTPWCTFASGSLTEASPWTMRINNDENASGKSFMWPERDFRTGVRRELSHWKHDIQCKWGISRNHKTIMVSWKSRLRKKESNQHKGIWDHKTSTNTCNGKQKQNKTKHLDSECGPAVSLRNRSRTLHCWES